MTSEGNKKNNWQLSNINSKERDSAIIVCASYEPRTTAIAERLSGQYRAHASLIYVNEEFLSGPAGKKTTNNLNILKTILSKHCNIVHIVTGSWLDPKKQLEKLKEGLSQAIESTDGSIAKTKVVTIDCTTFNREALLVVSSLTRVYFGVEDCRIVYVVPDRLGDWLTRGFRCVRNVMGFSGVQRAARPTALCVLSGFEGERVVRLIEEHEPNKVLLGLGNPPTAIEFFDRNQKEQQLVLARQGVEKFEFPADSILKCTERLEDVVSGYLKDYNVILAPMSTKLSTLACMLISLRHPEIQITYCVPGEYNVEDYSSGIRDIIVE
ncbi:hypothetical protein MUP77_17450, partial [Candidatus Bathyarchaeota archaeon]|nr:hypothetical protein [Candidatus Bathyarchaeota archaeon]